MIGILTVIVMTLIPFFYLFTQVHIVGNFTYAFGNIAGFIGAFILLWEFILGIKEIAKRIAHNPADYIKLHIILGVWGMFFVLIHPILEMLTYIEDITFLFIPDISSTLALHITYGRLALLFVVLVWLTSSFLRNKISYQKWLNIHYLSYPMMFFVFIHALEVGSFMNAFILIKVYWITAFSFFIGLCIWRVSVAIQNRI